MNIFYFDTDTKRCAKQHCDKHVVKMIIEYAQLLSTAHRVLDGTEQIVKSASGRNYKKWILATGLNEHLLASTHVNHPSNKWVRDNIENYKYLYELWIELLLEYTCRYNKDHAYNRLIDHLKELPKNIAIGNFSPPWRAMPEEYKLDKREIDYCEKSYQFYFNAEKQHIAKWKHGNIPSWFVQSN